MFDIRTDAPVLLGQIIFYLIVLHRCGANMSQKFPFPSLIFGLLEGQKPLQEPNEFLSAPVQLYIFWMKKKSVGVEGEPSGSVATEPSIATETQTAQPSSPVISFFRSELQAIREKQGVHDQRQDKVLDQLQSMEDLMYYAFIMLKCISPQEASDPPVPKPPPPAVGTLTQPEPSAAPT